MTSSADPAQATSSIALAVDKILRARAGDDLVRIGESDSPGPGGLGDEQIPIERVPGTRRTRPLVNVPNLSLLAALRLRRLSARVR